MQRTIEATGIPTVSITLVRKYTEKIKPPRAVYLHWPFGHPLGEPGNVSQQAAVLDKTFQALFQISEPGMIVDLNWRWRRESYSPAPWLPDPFQARQA